MNSYAKRLLNAYKDRAEQINADLTKGHLVVWKVKGVFDLKGSTASGEEIITAARVEDCMLEIQLDGFDDRWIAVQSDERFFEVL